MIRYIEGDFLKSDHPLGASVTRPAPGKQLASTRPGLQNPGLMKAT
jgi:hypothetical protein